MYSKEGKSTKAQQKGSFIGMRFRDRGTGANSHLISMILTQSSSNSCVQQARTTLYFMLRKGTYALSVYLYPKHKPSLQMLAKKKEKKKKERAEWAESHRFCGPVTFIQEINQN